MQQCSYTIQDKYGMHARPAGQLVRLASAYQCAVTVQHEDRSCTLKTPMHLMALGIMQGDNITVQAEGTEESECIAAVRKFLEENV